MMYDRGTVSVSDLGGLRCWRGLAVCLGVCFLGGFGWLLVRYGAWYLLYLGGFGLFGNGSVANRAVCMVLWGE